MAAVETNAKNIADPTPTATPSNPRERTSTSLNMVPGLTHSMSDCESPALSTPVETEPIEPQINGNIKSEDLASPRPALLTKYDSEVALKPRKTPAPALQRSATTGQAPRSTTSSKYQPGKFDSGMDESLDEEWAEECEKLAIAEGLSASPAKLKSLEKDLDKYSRFHLEGGNFATKGRVRAKDGRVDLSVHEKDRTGYLAKIMGTGFRHRYFHQAAEGELPGNEKMPLSYETEDLKPPPRLNIAVIVIGSRGDIQPFLKIGRILKNDYGHRVRIATHPVFKDFVEKDGGLEFFSIGGNPSELMAFMVKNPGLIPSVEAVRAGEIGKRRASMYEMFEGMWRACIHAYDDGPDSKSAKGPKYMPFVADAIIANPPCFVHNHIAERLGIPLHIMFTFPWTPTTQFPHPLANIRSSNVDHEYANFMSYPLVELLTWQGLGDLVNKFRVQHLGLDPVSTFWAPGQLYRMKVPFSYMWSPGLVPKPHDYGTNIDVCGFVFFEQASTFKPPEPLRQFLAAGPPPVYIGFGSIVVDDPNTFTAMIFKAVKLAGVRALVSKGWGGLGGGELQVPEDIFLLEATPHDWLFPQVSAVIHHGGAGTTAMGLKCGRPTMIVPFFGDQPFWGDMVARKRAGAFECIPYKNLTAESMAVGIKQCLSEEAKVNAAEIAESIAKEGDGALNAVKSFHRHLNLSGRNTIRCSILENHVSVWEIKAIRLRLSVLAVSLLVQQHKIEWKDLRLVRHNEWNDFIGPGGPITGALGSLFTTAADVGKGIGAIPVDTAHTIKVRRKHAQKKRQLSQQKQASEDESGSDASNSEDKNTNNLQPQISADPRENIVEEIAEETGRGLGRAGTALLEMPMNLGLGLTQGFHNIPRLYGDETVRQPVRITGYKSGLRAGRNEFIYGVYDGFTGVVTQPYKGAKEYGLVGGLEGLAIGLGGLVVKNMAAVIGPFAYTAKGLQKELQRANQPTKFIRKARIIQGSKESWPLRAVSNEKHEAIRREGLADVYHPLPGETLAEVEQKVNDGFDIIEKLLDAINKKKNQGGPLKLKGKVSFMLAEQKWKEAGAFESVKTAEVALNATRAGQNIDEALAAYRKQENDALAKRRLKTIASC